MATIRDIITGSLRLLEVVGAGEAPSSEDAADCLSSLSSMMDSWSIDGDKIWTESIETFNLTAGVDTYTIGAGGALNTVMPSKIRAATLNLNNSVTTPLQIMSAEDYAVQPDKFISGRPYGFYYQMGYPLSTLRFYYIPNAEYVFNLYSEKQLSTYSLLDDTLIAPAGVERALRYNLAVEVSSEYGKTPSPIVVAIATESKQTLENYISQNDSNKSRMDDAWLSAGRSYNVLAGR